MLGAVDRAAFRAADLVVADTATHAELFGRLGARRVEVCFVGAEERVFRPGLARGRAVHALFVGKLIPLHGIETDPGSGTARARDSSSGVIGSGQLEHVLRGEPPTSTWVPWVEYSRLPEQL